MATLIDARPAAYLGAENSVSRADASTAGGFALRLILGRLFTIALGVAAVVWGLTTFPVFWRQVPIESTAAAIIGDSAFKPNALAPLLPAVERVEHSPHCRPEVLHSAAIIRLRFAEDAMASGDRQAIDGRLGALDRAIHRSLACAPSDSFLWMVLAWIDGARNGPAPRQLTYLRLSYQLGPNEGWVAARRNRFALAMFPRLPPDLAEAAVHEFARMVDSWIYWDAIAIFKGPGWPIRERLLASLKDDGLVQREDFYVELYNEGYNIVVPGVPVRKPQLWY